MGNFGLRYRQLCEPDFHTDFITIGLGCSTTMYVVTETLSTCAIIIIGAMHLSSPGLNVTCHYYFMFKTGRPTPARESSYEKRRENPAFVSPALQPRRVNTHKVSVVRREVYEKLVPFDVRRPELRAKNDVAPHSSTPRGHVISSRVRCYNTCSIFFSGQ